MPTFEPIAGKFWVVEPVAEGIHKPFVYVSFERVNGSPSAERHCLLDTGAGVNMIELHLATLLTGISKDVITNAPPFKIQGVGGKISLTYPFTATIQLRGSSGGSACTWRDVVFYASEEPVPYRMLIGQRGGLQGHAFIHMSYSWKGQGKAWKFQPK